MKDYLGEPSKASVKLIGPTFTFEACQKYEGDEKSSCEKSAVYQFTADYYKGDRAMRESGFDISFRFGDFSGNTHHYAPVCLNSLLYKTETDMASISKLLGKTGRCRDVDQAGANPQGADRPISVERAGGNVFRLRLHQEQAVEVSIRDDVLSALGRELRRPSKPRRCWRT